MQNHSKKSTPPPTSTCIVCDKSKIIEHEKEAHIRSKEHKQHILFLENFISTKDNQKSNDSSCKDLEHSLHNCDDKCHICDTSLIQTRSPKDRGSQRFPEHLSSNSHNVQMTNHGNKFEKRAKNVEGLAKDTIPETLEHTFVLDDKVALWDEG